jgi:hypothetical protein
VKFITEAVAANYGRQGIECLRLEQLPGDDFSRIRNDVLAFVEAQEPSVVNEKKHITNWTMPYGTALQYSLWNGSGNPMDWSTDHNRSPKSKKFHHHDKYPDLGRFIDRFAAYGTLCNMRLNSMGKESGLSPHKEQIVFNHGGPVVRVRFHLPVQSNPSCLMMLNWKLFRFEPGWIYFFNNGAIHCSRNGGVEPRYHLVWDMLLTKRLHEEMFARAELMESVGTEPAKDYPVEGEYVSETDAAKMAFVEP